MRLNDLIDIVKDDPVGVKLFILDACRNNPVAKEKGLEAGSCLYRGGQRPGAHRVCHQRRRSRL